MYHYLFLVVLCLAGMGLSQSEDAYSYGATEKKSVGLLDPSRLTIRNSVSFGATGGAGANGLQSQSLYTTMMRYQFAAPVTLNLNFGLPIHSTFSSTQNLTSNNLQSLDYFKSMPIEMSLQWQPTENTMLQVNFLKAPAGGYFYNNFNNFRYDEWDLHRRLKTGSE